MSQSIDKEKNSRKNFSALDKIKKSKKNTVAEKEETNREEHFNIDSILKSDAQVKYVSPATILNDPNPTPVSIPSIVKEESVVVVEEKEEEEVEIIPNKKVEEYNFDIASKLNLNPVQELEDVQTDKSLLTQEPEEIKIEKRTSASIAKDRLREDVLGEVARTPLMDLENRRTITANDNLTQILGSPQGQPVEIYPDEEPSVEKNEVVITNSSVFIPWEKAPDEDKRKARRIMKASLASTILALTYFTFHS